MLKDASNPENSSRSSCFKLLSITNKCSLFGPQFHFPRYLFDGCGADNARVSARFPEVDNVSNFNFFTINGRVSADPETLRTLADFSEREIYRRHGIIAPNCPPYPACGSGQKQHNAKNYRFYWQKDQRNTECCDAKEQSKCLTK